MRATSKGERLKAYNRDPTFEGIATRPTMWKSSFVCTTYNRDPTFEGIATEDARVVHGAQEHLTIETRPLRGLRLWYVMWCGVLLSSYNRDPTFEGIAT